MYAKLPIVCTKLSCSLALTVLPACGGTVTGAPGDAERSGDASTPGDGYTSGDASTPGELGTKIAEIHIVNPWSTDESDVPITFGHVFHPADVVEGQTVSARLEGTPLPLQVDMKNRHADGSLRHAVLTVQMPSSPAGGDQVIELFTAIGSDEAPPVATSDLIATDFDVTVSATIGDRSYTASARELLADTDARLWLSGALASEWIVSAPLVAGGEAHPHLTARFSIRSYPGAARARVAVMVENAWAYEPAPQNFVYDARVRVGETEAFVEPGLTHFSHARWRKTFWWGDEVLSEAALDKRYLIASGAVPHYDPDLVVHEETLAALAERWPSEEIGPMDVGLMTKGMPDSGAHPDIGPLTLWDSLYLCSMDSRARVVTLGLADLAGSWPIHYRDKVTDLPVSLDDYPYMTLVGTPGDAYNRAMERSELFPACAGDCSTPYVPDSAHQPSLGYLAYLVTGEYDYLEELHFWANWNMFVSNPHYRALEKGLLHPGQVRSQAWSFRTLGFAAYITPDDHPMKAYFLDRVGYNVEWYLGAYTEGGPRGNALGIATKEYVFGYDDGRGMAPWQDDFLTWSVGQLVAMGFEEARPLMEYKVKFVIGRMTDPAFCPVFASSYSMVVRESWDGPLYEDFGQLFNAAIAPETRALPCGSEEMGDALGLLPGEMVGYARSPTGYPANMQPAVAVAAESSVANGAEAWSRFEGRPAQPDYGRYPNFAITPRGP